MKTRRFNFTCPAVAVAVLLWAGLPAVHAAKGVSEQWKPHVAVGTIGQVQGELLLTDEPSDFVLVPFHARVMVFADRGGNVGRATGIIRLGLPEQSADGAEELVLEVIAAGGITYEANQIKTLILTGLRRGAAVPADEFTVTVSRTLGSSTLNEDCLIWDIAGPEVHDVVHAESFMELVAPPPGLARDRVEWLLRVQVHPTDKNQPVLVFKDSSSAGVTARLRANLVLRSDGTAGGTLHLRFDTGEEIRLRAIAGQADASAPLEEVAFVFHPIKFKIPLEANRQPWSLTVTPIDGDEPMLHFELTNNEETWRFDAPAELEFIRSRARR